MFYEFRYVRPDLKYDPIFNMKGHDHRGTLSIEKMYLSYATEYDAAIGILGSWSHWEKLCKCNWFKEHKARWDEERDTRNESIARRTLLKEAENGNVNAAKAVLAESKKRRFVGAGRPVNKQVPSRDPRDDEQLESMIKRFKVINGNKEE